MEYFFNRIAGYKGEKESLKEICYIMGKFHELRGMGIRLPHGVLLSGAPGVGKTVMAEALIEGCGVDCFKVSAGDCDEDNLSEHIEESFAMAREKAPAIVFLDELDKIVGLPGSMHSSYNMDNSRKLLQIMNDFKSDDIMVVATVNDIDMLCGALKRSGRFDRIIDVHMPTLEDRREIIKFYCSDKPIGKDVDCNLLAKMTAGLSGADIECIVNEAGIHAVMHRRKQLSAGDFQHAIERMLFKAVEHECTMDEEQKRVIATHEAGHLVAGLFLKADSISGASILPQGESEGHCTIASMGKSIPSLKDIETSIIVGLSGKASETVFFPDETYLGSSSDINNAIHFATRLVKNEGAFGLDLCQGGDPDFPFSMMSDDKQRRIENKCNEIINKCYEMSLTIIKENRPLVKALSDRLVSQYTLSRSEIFKIFRSYLRKESKKTAALNKVSPSEAYISDNNECA